MNDFLVSVPSFRDPQILDLVSELACAKPQVVQNSPAPFSDVHRCYPNVEEAIRNFGGEMVQGWMFFDYEGFFFEAQHHAVWKAPDGHLVCVTPHTNTQLDSILFSIAKAPLFEGKRIGNRRRIVQKEKEVSAYISLVDELKEIQFLVQDEQLPEDAMRNPIYALKFQSLFHLLDEIRKK